MEGSVRLLFLACTLTSQQLLAIWQPAWPTVRGQSQQLKPHSEVHVLAVKRVGQAFRSKHWTSHIPFKLMTSRILAAVVAISSVRRGYREVWSRDAEVSSRSEEGPVSRRVDVVQAGRVSWGRCFVVRRWDPQARPCRRRLIPSLSACSCQRTRQRRLWVPDCVPYGLIATSTSTCTECIEVCRQADGQDHKTICRLLSSRVMPTSPARSPCHPPQPQP